MSQRFTFFKNWCSCGRPDRRGVYLTYKRPAMLTTHLMEGREQSSGVKLTNRIQRWKTEKLSSQSVVLAWRCCQLKHYVQNFDSPFLSFVFCLCGIVEYFLVGGPAGPAGEQSSHDDRRRRHPPPVHRGEAHHSEAGCIDTQLSRSCLMGSLKSADWGLPACFLNIRKNK